MNEKHEKVSNKTFLLPSLIPAVLRCSMVGELNGFCVPDFLICIK